MFGSALSQAFFLAALTISALILVAAFYLGGPHNGSGEDSRWRRRY